MFAHCSHNRLRRPLLCICLFLAVCGGVDGSTQAAETSPAAPFDVPISQAEQEIIADAADGELADRMLLQAALVASGVEQPAQWARLHWPIDRLEEELLAADGLLLPARRRAQLILTAMHHRLFSNGYQTDCSNLDLALQQGKMNCVSATVIFNELAQRMGLTVAAAERPGHVVSQIYLDDAWWEIETTQPKRAWTRVDAAATDRITAPALVAILYYNRAWQSFNAGDFSNSVILNAKACQVDPASTASRRNLLIALNHWGLAESKRGKHARAVELLTHGQTIAPNDQSFGINLAVVLQRQRQAAVIPTIDAASNATLDD